MFRRAAIRSTASGIGRILGAGIICTTVSSSCSHNPYATAVLKFSRYNLCPDDRIAVTRLAPREPPADVAADPQRLAMWREKYEGSSWYRLDGCGATTVYRCAPPITCQSELW